MGALALSPPPSLPLKAKIMCVCIFQTTKLFPTTMVMPQRLREKSKHKNSAEGVLRQLNYEGIVQVEKMSKNAVVGNPM